MSLLQERMVVTRDINMLLYYPAPASNYIPQNIFSDCKGKVMFSEASVSHSVHKGLVGQTPPWRYPPWRQIPGGKHPPGGRPLVVTFSGGRCSSRYASHWNALLFDAASENNAICAKQAQFC